MSSILKALRKLEEEKAALGEGGVDISRDILKRSARKKGSSVLWPLVSVVLLVLLVAVAAFWGLSDRSSSVVLQQDMIAIPLRPAVQPPKQEVPAVVAEVTMAKAPQTVTVPTVEAPVLKAMAVPRVQVEPEALRPNGSPFLKLTGIAYRENSVERIAIINDLPVMQGTSIEGAQLIKILPDRVVLSWRGDEFPLLIEAEKQTYR